MKFAICIAIISLCLTGAVTLVAAAQSNQPDEVEYKLKAVCLYNFLKFTRWPDQPVANDREKKGQDSNDVRTGGRHSPIVVAILGEDSIAEAFMPLQKKSAQDRNIVIRKLGCLQEQQAGDDAKASAVVDSNSLRNCHVLFISSSHKAHAEKIVASLGSAPVLTIGETDGFLKAGGIINFVNVDNRVTFEISRPALERANLMVEPEVFRLARRVVDDE